MSLSVQLSQFRWGICTPFRKTSPLCHCSQQRGWWSGGGGGEAQCLFCDCVFHCSCSPTVERGVCIFTQQKPHYLSAFGDLISSQIIFGLLERRTHCTLSVGLIISILETVIYEILTVSHPVFTLSKAQNIVIVCDVLETLVAN